MSKSLLERTFPIVYGVELKDVLGHEDLAVGSYRFAVGYPRSRGSVFPKIE